MLQPEDTPGAIADISGNHTAYKQVKGTKTSAAGILELYDGLRQSNLTNFDVLLTGYMPSAEAVQAIGTIGRDIKFNAGTKPGSFFWGEWGLQRSCMVGLT
jgi:pyridoxine kinase